MKNASGHEATIANGRDAAWQAVSIEIGQSGIFNNISF
jgi:hypothetical protein